MTEDTGKNAAAQPTQAHQDSGQSISQTQNGHAEKLSTVEENLDIWRILLVDLAYLLSSYFVDVQYWEGVKSEKDTFEQLTRTLRKLARMPEQDRTLLIRLCRFVR